MYLVNTECGSLAASACRPTGVNEGYYSIIQSNRTTRSSDIITLQRPSVRSRLKVIDRSFTQHAPVLWNSLPKQLRQPSKPQSLDIIQLI